MDFDLLYPGRFLKAADFRGKDVTLTIKSVRIEKLVGEKGEKVKGIVAFEERPKELVLNRTNGLCIKAMFGRETDGWVGKKVTLWPAPMKDSFTGEDIIAIRVRGSPDIAADKSFTAKLGFKQATLKVFRTGQKAAAPAKAAAKPAPAPPVPTVEDVIESTEPDADEAALIQADENAQSMTDKIAARYDEEASP